MFKCKHSWADQMINMIALFIIIKVGSLVILWSYLLNIDKSNVVCSVDEITIYTPLVVLKRECGDSCMVLW